MNNRLLYGVWERTPTGWRRLFPWSAYPKRQAVRVFQSALLNAAMMGGKERKLIAVGHEWSHRQ